MAFRHAFDLQSITQDKITITFSSGSSYSYSRSDEKAQCGLSALHALLILHCGLKETEDFECSNKDTSRPSIEIKGKANCVSVLNFLLGNAASALFSINSIGYSFQDNPKLRWQAALGKMIVSCIEDKNLTLKEYEQIYPIMRAYLDRQMELLRQESCVQVLQIAVVNPDEKNLLKHPFYQTLSLMMDDFTAKKQTYKKKGFFERIGESKPAKSPYEDVYKKFIEYIPSCFCDLTQTSQYTTAKTLNADKLKQSRSADSTSEVKTLVKNVMQ